MASVVINKEAYVSYISMGKSPKATTQYLIDDNNISQEEHDTILYKFKSLKSSREYYRKKSDLETWENMTFHSYTAPLSISIPRKKRISLDPGLEPFRKVSISESRNFSEEIVHDSRKHLLDCNLQTSRSSLSILLDHIHFLAERENVEPKQLAALALGLISNNSYDRDTSQVCKEIINKGSFNGILHKAPIDKSAFLLDCLEIGASKYKN
ncbi:hypothetical protein LOD99_4070 [Oopsacas minuta]|uniref:Uncharacterized protein n=1 Tax=Oopsacas minuta TaxID=111878 RepID=A0AAV7JVF0_9METZ|nr:hypothetical protein LOD99_4070 [Oopsacas minuta]